MPEPLGNAPSIIDQVVALHVAADVLDIAHEKGEGVPVRAWIDGLWKVYDFRLTLPVEDVIGREIAVHIVVLQPELNIVHQEIEDGARLFLGQCTTSKGGRRLF